MYYYTNHFYQLWSFVAPGLHAYERQFIYKYSFFCAILFISGVAFAFFIGFPMIINFSENLSHLLSIDQVIGFKAYLGELIRWLLVFGFIFQLPILFMGLAHFGLIDVTQLGRYRKYVYFACFVAASIIAPPDLILNLVLTLPLIILFEISMFIAKITSRKQKGVRQKYNLSKLFSLSLSQLIVCRISFKKFSMLAPP